jgi:hypothetical protein
MSTFSRPGQAGWLTAAGAVGLAVVSLTAAAPAASAQVAAGASAVRGASAVAGVRAAKAVVPPPVPRGRLRISGRLRDGATVSASGLSWHAPRLPAGDKLLSFEVAYTWRRCPVGGGACAAAADSTVTPFAASRYTVGHGDTGSRLRVTVTAAEVVETDPATFSFRVVRRSASRLAGAATAAFPAGRRPWARFVNGTPEQHTASAEEYFHVSVPHYNRADGTPVQRYRVDGGPWRVLPANRTLYAAGLKPGPHRVAVRTSNVAGSSVVRFSWHVVPMPAPVACQPSAAGGPQCWYPPHLAANGHPMRWDWQIGRVTPLQRTGRSAVDLYDIDGFLTTRAQVTALHTRWQAATLPHPKAVCYLDLAWEDYRPDGSPGQSGGFPAAALGHVYFGFAQERWVDVRQLDALKPMLAARISMCARKGFDAVELDDIDSFDPPSTTGFRLTPGDWQNFLAYAFNEIHRDGMTGLWKNSPVLSWWGRKYADGAVVEECYVGHACFASSLRGTHDSGITCTALTGRTPCGWDDFSTDKTAHQPNGKWVGEAEYSNDHFVCSPGQHCKPSQQTFAAFCRAVYSPSSGFAAVKFDADLNGKTFFPCPAGK